MVTPEDLHIFRGKKDVIGHISDQLALLIRVYIKHGRHNYPVLKPRAHYKRYPQNYQHTETHIIYPEGAWEA